MFILQHETDEFLDYIGFVPGLVVDFVRHVSVGRPDDPAAFDASKARCRRALTDVLVADLQQQHVATLKSYVNAIALCVMDGLTSDQLSEVFGISKVWLAWTFLKQEDEQGKITAVSSLARDVVRSHLSQNKTTLEHMVKSRELS